MTNFTSSLLRQRVEVLHAEAVCGRPCTRALHIDDLVNGLGNIGQRTFAGGLDHQGVAFSQQSVHQRQELARLQHRLAAGELNQLARRQRLDLRDDLVLRKRLAAGRTCTRSRTRRSADCSPPSRTKMHGSPANDDSPWTDL